MDDVMNAARDAIERDNLDLADNLLLRPAYSGNALAQFLLGHLCFTSAYALLSESCLWLEPVAALNHADPLFHLSPLHDDGSIRPPVKPLRRSLLLKAAELGSPQARPDKGCYYATGEAGFPHAPCLGRLW